ncbi:MAG: hypothetical protein J5I35_07655 [Methanothrix harundinacea]|nr:hypothetical protein [Methanothrix harundinacea]
MAIADSVTKIHCQRCGHQFDRADEFESYWFIGLTLGSGESLAPLSPKKISDEGDSIIHCAFCDDEKIDKAMESGDPRTGPSERDEDRRF